MSLTFYDAPRSTASITRLVLAELAVPHETVRVDLKAGDTREPWFVAINPNGKVPVVVHDGEAIFESAAITIYLGETFGVVKGLFPAPGRGRGRAVKWLVWCAASLAEVVERYGQSRALWGPAEQLDVRSAIQAREQIEGHLRVLDHELSSSEYLLGERYSLVDAHLWGYLTFVIELGFHLDPYPALAAWSERCAARPSAHAMTEGV